MDDNVALFNARAAAWDASPYRRKLAHDIALAMEQAGLFREPVDDALDFGCGTGLLTLELAARCARVTGIDTSPGMLAGLDAKIETTGLDNVATLLADLAAGDPVPGHYGLVASGMALHHVPEIEPVLARLFGLTDKNGRLALADLDSEGGAFHENPAGVYHSGFDRLELADVLAGTGYTDINAITAGSLEKPQKDGSMRAFTIFLMTARKP